MAGRKVLVVEDDPALRFSVVAYLEDNEYDVIEAVDGQDGLEAFARSSPDAVVLDLRMPRVDGFRVIEAIRADSNVPLIVLTGTGQNQACEEALTRGATCCLFKPLIDMSALTAAIESAFEHQAAKRTEP